MEGKEQTNAARLEDNQAPHDLKQLVGFRVGKLVTFSRVNLLDSARMALMEDMDLIFCANVLIYFDLDSKRTVIGRFFNSLLAHGYFFLGHSESLYGVCDQFKLIHLPSATAYVKVQPQAAAK